MTRKKKSWLIAGFTALGLIIIALFTFKPVIERIGENELREIARYYGNCKTDTCYEGMLSTGLDLADKTGIEPELIPWCLAANSIDNTDFHFANAAKTKFVEWMLSSCGRGELTLDDANITIGGEHENH